MTPEPGEVYERILAELKSIWGEFAAPMLRKRIRDVGADVSHLTREHLLRIVQLLRERTLPSIMGLEGAELKAKQWLAWVENGQ